MSLHDMNNTATTTIITQRPILFTLHQARRRSTPHILLTMPLRLLLQVLAAAFISTDAAAAAPARWDGSKGALATRLPRRTVVDSGMKIYRAGKFYFSILFPRVVVYRWTGEWGCLIPRCHHQYIFSSVGV